MSGRTARQQGIGVVAVLVLVMVAGLVSFGAWKVWDANRSQPADSADNLQPPAKRTFTSAKGLFEITFPEGWQDIRRIMDSDRFVISGMAQPVARDGQPVMVKDEVTFDDDITTVFDVSAGSDFPPPEGMASDFLAGSGAQLLSGRKYAHEYNVETTDSKGRKRDHDDRDYTYVFALGGGRELRVTYSVYRDDPRDQSEVIDQVVKSIRKLK